MQIFLDIDGVMVPAKSWSAPPLHNDGFPLFSVGATAALCNLITPDTVIVLTTSHKTNYSEQEWKTMFKNRGIEIDRLQCLPANTANLSRREEILNWFMANNVEEEYVIIDDDKSLNDLPPQIKQYLLQTTSHIGLTTELVEAYFKK